MTPSARRRRSRASALRWCAAAAWALAGCGGATQDLELLAEQRDVLGIENRDTQRTMGSLANLYQQTDRYDACEAINRELAQDHDPERLLERIEDDGTAVFTADSVAAFPILERINGWMESTPVKSQQLTIPRVSASINSDRICLLKSISY